jgi:hypothetical protein
MFSQHTKIIERSPKNIDLDFKNPRLTGYLKRQNLNTQREIVRVLAENYGVLNICKSIVVNGFHPDEVLITIPDEAGKLNRLSVIEGNRRLCACKILLNPELLKGTKEYAKIQRISKHENFSSAVKSVNKINVVQLNGRQDAAAYLASKHTQESIKSWSTYTQGAYFVSFKAPGMQLSEVASILGGGVPVSALKQKVFFYLLTEHLLDLNCWNEDEYSQLVENIDRIKTEAMIRVIQSSDFKNDVGIIGVSNKGVLFFEKLDESAANAIIEKLARDTNFNKNDEGSYILTTRQENKDFMNGYIQECYDEAQGAQVEEPQKSRTEFSNTDYDNSDTENGFDDDDNDNDLDNVKIKKTRPKKKRLLSAQTELPTGNPKLCALVEEAIKLDFMLYKYTSALLSRAIIEVTIKSWIKKCGLESRLKTTYKDKAFNFQNLLMFLELESKALITDDDDALKAIRSATQGLLKVDKDIMNLTNHNDLHVLSDNEISHIKDKLSIYAAYFFSRMK